MLHNDTYLMPLPVNTTTLSKSIKEYIEINEPSSSNPFTLWNSHKAFVHGILVKMSSTVNKHMMQQLDKLLSTIHTLEISNKQNPSQTIGKQLTQLNMNSGLLCCPIMITTLNSFFTKMVTRQANF